MDKSPKELIMKNTFKLIGIIAVIAMIGLSLGSCGEYLGNGPAAFTFGSVSVINSTATPAVPSYTQGLRIFAPQTPGVASVIVQHESGALPTVITPEWTTDVTNGNHWAVTYTPATSGKVDVTITGVGGTYVLDGYPRQVSVIAPAATLTPVTFSSAIGNSSSTGTETTLITLAFSAAVTGLTADNITITGNGGVTLTKGSIGGSGTNWTIGVSAVSADGTVTVSLTNPSGFNITPTSISSVNVYTASTP